MRAEERRSISASASSRSALEEKNASSASSVMDSEYSFHFRACSVRFSWNRPRSADSNSECCSPKDFVVELWFGDRKPVLQSGAVSRQALAGACRVHPREPGIRGG